MLKTLEEPASFVHLILLTDRLTRGAADDPLALPAGPVRRAPGRAGRRARVEEHGRRARDRARLRAAGARRRRAGARAGRRGRRGAARRRPSGSRARRWPARRRRAKPWAEMLAAVAGAGRGGQRTSSSAQATAELELYPRKERKRIETEWSERIRRARRRAETGGARSRRCRWSRCGTPTSRRSAWGADELVRNADRLDRAARRRRVRSERLLRGGRAGRGDPAALSAQRLRGAGVRGARVPAGAGARADEAATAGRTRGRGRVFLRTPAASDRDEFIALMRASRSFHRPWATAPTDDERFAAYLADSRRADFEAMLVVPARGPRDPRLLQPLADRRGARSRAPTSATRSASRIAGQGYMREGIELVAAPRVRGPAAAPDRGQHPARQPRVDRARTGRRLPARGLLAPVPEDRRALARPRALGDPRRRLAQAPGGPARAAKSCRDAEARLTRVRRRSSAGRALHS